MFLSDFLFSDKKKTYLKKGLARIVNYPEMRAIQQIRLVLATLFYHYG